MLPNCFLLITLLSFVQLLTNGVQAAVVGEGQGVSHTSYRDLEYFHCFGDSYTTWRYDINTSPKPKLPHKPLGVDYPGLGSPNGPNWIARLTQDFNQSAVLAFNMAFGGATVDRYIVSPFQDYILTFREQVTKWQSRLGNKPNTAAWPYPWTGDRSLFVLWFGVNDIWRSHDWMNISQSALQNKVIDSYFAGMKELYDTGARKFLIINVPPMELSPELRGRPEPQQESVRNAVIMFNNKLVAKVSDCRINWKQATLFLIDIHTLFHSIYMNAFSYGFLNKVSACPHYAPFQYADLGCNSATGNYIWESKYDSRCSGPVSRYMWLDAWHPTSKVHEVIAGKVAQELADNP